MSDDLERKLNKWGSQATPPTDPAFTNRLESTLRSTMLTNEERTDRPLFRPGLIVAVLAVIATVGVFAISANQTGEAETANTPSPFEDDSAELAATTTTSSTTPADADTAVPPTTTEPTVSEPAPTTTASLPPSEENSPPRTGTAPPPQEPDPVDRLSLIHI